MPKLDLERLIRCVNITSRIHNLPMFLVQMYTQKLMRFCVYVVTPLLENKCYWLACLMNEANHLQ